MTNQQRPNEAYLRDLEAAFDHFVEMVEAENAALEQHDTARLKLLTPQKVQASKDLDSLTRSFVPKFGTATEEEKDSFTAVVNRAVSIRPLLERNMALLNAAKVTAANRIEAGLAAWRRSQNEKSIGYAEDGRTAQPEYPTPFQPGRLI